MPFASTECMRHALPLVLLLACNACLLDWDHQGDSYPPGGSSGYGSSGSSGQPYACQSYTKCIEDAECPSMETCNQATGYCQKQHCGGYKTWCSEDLDCRIGYCCLQSCACDDDIIDVEPRCQPPEWTADLCDELCHPPRATRPPS